MITMPTATTKTTTPTRTGLSITGPTTVEHWRESFLDRIAITGALLDEADRERLGAWIECGVGFRQLRTCRRTRPGSYVP
jgi:hypothetical protein